MHADILLSFCLKLTLPTKVFAVSVYLVLDKLQSRNQDVCHPWHRNLLTGCHGDRCQAGAQVVLGEMGGEGGGRERERERERETQHTEAGHL